MNWTEGIQNAINYIESHLTEPLDNADIAAQAACSPFYFQKIFSLMCGITLGEYIRSRRLSEAGSELANSGAKVIDTALKYGYDSPESFTRAFTRFHGITPTDARRGCTIRTFSPFRVTVILKGGSSIDYTLVRKDEFTVLEKVEQQIVSRGDNVNTVPGFWQRAQSDGTIAALLSNASDRSFVFGISYGSGHTDCEHFDYSIAVQCSPDTVPPEGFRVNTIPARTWVVSKAVGAMPDSIEKLWRDMCTVLFPTSTFRPTYEMDIEAYPAGPMAASDYHTQIWIPVREE